MQFKPNYKPYDQALTDLANSLTPKQRQRYDNMTGYFATRLVKISKSPKMEAAIASVEAIRDQCREDYYDWFDKFQADHSDELDATVLWFNKNSGDGMAQIGELTSDIYACNIAGKKTWYPETACVYYEKGQTIKVKLSFHGYMSQIFVIGLTPGHFDAEGWTSLDQDRLAFKCDDEGNATNGLFAQGAGLV